MDTSGFIVLLSGPSGAGKSSLVSYIEEKIPDLHFSISLTTREKRDGEKDGVDYFFVDKEEFEKDIDDGKFLEWAKVHDNYYGTSLKQTMDAIKSGKIVIFDIDVQGFLQAKEKMGDIITSVFVTTPTRDELKKRLEKRGTDNEEVILKRVKNAEKELEYAKYYDYFIVNDDLDKAKEELLKIVEVSKIKTSSINLNNFIKKWIE